MRRELKDDKLGAATIYAFFQQSQQEMQTLDELVLCYERSQWLSASAIGTSLDSDVDRLRNKIRQQIDIEENSVQKEQLRYLIELLDLTSESQLDIYSPDALSNLPVSPFSSKVVDLLLRRSARNELQKADRDGDITWSWCLPIKLKSDIVQFCIQAHPNLIKPQNKTKRKQNESEEKLSADAESQMRATGWSEKEIARVLAYFEQRNSRPRPIAPKLPDSKEQLESTVTEEVKNLVSRLSSQMTMIINLYLDPFRRPFISSCWEGWEVKAQTQPIIDYSQRIAQELDTNPEALLVPRAKRLLGESALISNLGLQRFLCPDDELAKILGFVTVPEGDWHFANKYWTASGVQYDKDKAFSWALKGAFAGHTHTQLLMGMLCLLRESAEKEEARYWFKQAYEKGNLDAGYLYVAATLRSKDYAEGTHYEAIAKLLPAISEEEEHPAAQCLLAEILAGRGSTDEAILLFQKSAKHGFGRARMHLERHELTGNLFETYEELESSEVSILLKKAEKSDANAIYSLLRFYRNRGSLESDGVSVGPKLLESVEALGPVDSTVLNFQIGRLLGLLQRHEESLTYMKKAALGGNYDACDYLRRRTEDQDIPKAIEWHELAMKHAGFRGSEDYKILHGLKLRLNKFAMQI